MKKELLEYKYDGDAILCKYNCIKLTIDADYFWYDYIVENGYHEVAINGFDPTSLYGHTQKCYYIDKEQYLSDIPPEVLIQYIQYELSFN